jgi:hypothetical protein
MLLIRLGTPVRQLEHSFYTIEVIDWILESFNFHRVKKGTLATKSSGNKKGLNI